MRNTLTRVCLVVLVTFSFLACVAGKTKRRLAGEVVTQEGFERDRSASQQFDRFLWRQLSKTEEERYRKQCRADQTVSPFCYSVINRELLEERAKTLLPQKTKRAKLNRVIPKYQRGKWVNWLDLRYSSVSALMNGIAQLSHDHVALLRQRVIEETKCPNNVAIALAAHLEDGLPNRYGYSDLAELYRKGGECLTGDAEEMVAILTRAGIFSYVAKNYAQAQSTLEAANQPKEAFRARTLYWLQKTYEKLNEKEKAQAAFKELKEAYPFSFHSVMALIAAKEDPGEILSRRSPEDKTRSSQLPQLNHLIEQVEILNRFGFNKAADKVLTWAIAESPGAEPEVMIYLSDLRETQGNYVSKISILSSVLYQSPELISQSVMEKYFPKVYFPLFEKHSNGIDPYLLMALARRESAFNARALSRTRAKGLMQLMPSTLRGLSYDKDLFDPESNVFVGSRYLNDLLGRSKGQIHMALAAYNAGPNRLETWLLRYPSEDPILFTDLLPFRETRDYVASVIRNYYWYRRIHQNDSDIQPRHLLQLSRNSAADTASEASRN